ncbi:hypothetical protein V6N13_126872 [Hibiscus sabdariffa]
MGGRPPESIPHVTFNQPLERVGSPLAAEDQPVVKRGRNNFVAMDNMEVSESMEMEADGMLSTKEREAPAGDASTGTQPRVSYTHVVRDSLRGKDHTPIFEDLNQDKIIVRDEDCVVDHLGRFPRISFAESVHAQVDLTSISTVTGPTLESCNITSSKELFGPWMVVDNRRRRTPPYKPSGGRQDLVVTEPRGSRFAVLDSGATVEDMITGGVEVSPQASDELAPTVTDVQVAPGPGIVRTATFGAETPQRKPKSSSASSSRIETIPMLLVASMVDNSGEWWWSEFQHLLPVQVLLRLVATKTPSPLFSEDELSAFGVQFMISRSQWLADSTKKALAKRYSQMQLNTNVSRPISRWFTPPMGWIKLNTDGACRSVTGHSRCGGVFRNFEGVWLHGFSKFIGCCSILEDELSEICIGLSLAWVRGFRCIMVESDCLEAIRMLHPSFPNGASITLVRDICRLCSQD